MAEKQSNEQEIIQKFNVMKQELQQIAQKIGELEQEKEEHQMVIDTLKPLKEDRTCYRLVGGILVQKNVKETLPSVEANQQGIVSLMTTLANSYKQKEDQLVEYQKKFNIKVQ